MIINFKRQQGTVLIVALFIVALLEIVVVGFVMHHKMSIYHSRNYVDLIEAQSILLGGEEQAKQAILASFNSQKTLSNYPIVKTAQNGAVIEGIVMDAQGTFNINNIIAENNDEPTNKNLTRFSNLLKTLFHEKNQDEVTALTTFLQLRSQLKPKSGKTMFINSITELRSVPGITSVFYTALAPYISALPSLTALNVNSANEYSLLTIDPKLTLKETKAIVRIRDSFEGGFSSTDSFEAIGPIQALEGDLGRVTILSDYYIASLTVHYQDVELTMNSLLKINTEDEKPSVKVIWRSFGTL